MQITAIFDDVDTAQHALVQLREQGLNLSAYKIKKVQPMQGQGEVDITDYGSLLGIATNQWTGLAPAIAMNPWPINNIGQDNSMPSLTPDGVSREVKLILTVEDSKGDSVRHALVSNHGRKVRVES